MRIVVDPGHGGHDPGAVNLEAGVQEKSLNLQISLALREQLLDGGHSVVLTRDGDRALELSDRVALANRIRPDAFISIHCNAAINRQARGMEVWTSPGDTASDALATEIGLALAAGVTDSPLRRDDTDGDLDKEGRLYVLTMTRCPAVLVECGFISNDDEARRLQDPARVQAIAEAIARGISKWGGAA
jgi:N-acetylmuramoyl-L-alanine amidase